MDQIEKDSQERSSTLLCSQIDCHSQTRESTFGPEALTFNTDPG